MDQQKPAVPAPAPAVKAKHKFLALLPKAAKAAANLRFEFENPIFSPGKDKKHNKPHHKNIGYSGPITSVILEQARSKSKNSRFAEAREPTSPTISCMGQIKYKRNFSLKKQRSLPRDAKPFSFIPRGGSRKKPPTTTTTKTDEVIIKKKKDQLKKFRNIYGSFKKPNGRKSDASAEVSRLPDRAPGLSQMKRFASSRETLSNFDWTTAAQVAPEEEEEEAPKYHRRYYSDDEKNCNSDGEEEEGITIRHSAPLPLPLPLEPKKEINLWKRRTVAQPVPLQLNKSK